tara:strand:- start:652 stop:834 length:183 start_codon:yes stop_codon:yes gene_type:complete
MLKSFDWYYVYSDDHRVWKSGSDKEDQLRKISRESIEHKKLWLGFNNWKSGHGEMPNEPT